MTTPEITYRQATPADLDTCAEVLYIADDELSASRGLPVSPRNREALVRLFAHMQATSPIACGVAEDGGQIIGFSASAEYQEMVYLGFLFVLPDIQAKGIGRRLLELSMHDSDVPRGRASRPTSPSRPRSTAWYGMTPRIPIYMMTGAATDGAAVTAGGTRRSGQIPVAAASRSTWRSAV